MILLDTNVLCEPLRPKPNPVVIAWIDDQIVETLYVSTISVTEMRYGILVLPDGKKKESLHASLDKHILPLFEARILSFDLAAAELCAELRVRARAAGENVGTTDSFIGAIAAVRNFTVATRDEQPYRAMGVAVINPWEGERLRL